MAGTALATFSASSSRLAALKLTLACLRILSACSSPGSLRALRRAPIDYNVYDKSDFVLIRGISCLDFKLLWMNPSLASSLHTLLEARVTSWTVLSTACVAGQVFRVSACAHAR